MCSLCSVTLNACFPSQIFLALCRRTWLLYEARNAISVLEPSEPKPFYRQPSKPTVLVFSLMDFVRLWPGGPTMFYNQILDVCLQVSWLNYTTQCTAVFVSSMLQLACAVQVVLLCIFETSRNTLSTRKRKYTIL